MLQEIKKVLNKNSLNIFVNCNGDNLRAVRCAWGDTYTTMSQRIGIDKGKITQYENNEKKGFHYIFALYWMTKYAIEIGALPPEVEKLFIDSPN